MLNIIGVIIIGVLLATVWLMCGFFIVIGAVKEQDEDLDGLDYFLILLGPVAVIAIGLFVALAPIVKHFDNGVAEVYYWIRIKREARAAKEISEAEPPFNPANYTPEQWRDHGRENTDNRNP